MHSVEAAGAIGAVLGMFVGVEVRDVGRVGVLDYHVWGALAGLVGMWSCLFAANVRNPSMGGMFERADGKWIA